MRIHTHSSHIHTPFHSYTHTHTHSQVLPADCTPFFLYMLWLPFAFYRLLQYFNLACLSMQCYGIDILSPSGGLNLVTTARLYLGGSTIALMFVSVYLSFVLPNKYSVRKKPFFTIIGRLSKFGTFIRVIIFCPK